MTFEFVLKHWALLSGGALGLLVALFAGFRTWQDSSRGRLGAELRRLRKVRSEARLRQRELEKAEATLARLQARSESVKPRRIQEASEAVEDGKALLKIVGDQVMVAETRVRTIIVEEFPPTSHDNLRRRYLEQ